MTMINYVATRGLKKLGYGRFLSISRYRIRKGLPPPPSASGPLLDEPDWLYPDGTPGTLTKGRSKRYLKDQDMGKVMVGFNKKFKEIIAARQDQKLTS